MGLKYKAACVSLIGLVREKNEDNVYFNKESLPENNQGTNVVLTCECDGKSATMFGVFDGMGGEMGGEIAAHEAALALKTQDTNKPTESSKIRDFLDDTVTLMNRAVHEKGQSLGAERMGTTAAILYVEKHQAYVCNVGDSRIYRYSDDTLMMLTDDDTFANPNVKNQALTQYIGVDPEQYRLSPHIKKGSLANGEIYLLCSDGLYNMVSAKEICEIIKQNQNDMALCAKILAKKAEENGGEDNCTLIMIRFEQNYDALLSLNQSIKQVWQDLKNGLHQGRHK